jgi:hypothetical protein
MTVLGLLFIALECAPDGLWTVVGGSLRRFAPKLRLRILDHTADVGYCVLAANALTATAGSYV